MKKKKLGRNDPCPCGSGKKYKTCCLKKFGMREVQEINTANKHQYTLKERNAILINAIVDIFGLAKNAKWDEVKSKITAGQVKEFYKVIAWLWPPDTDIMNLLPTPSDKLRALYLGDARPELLVRNIFRFALYTDEILIVDPFHNPWCMAKKFNPLEIPEQYKADTLKLIYFVLLLEPWIRANLVTFIPDPGNFDYDLRKKTWKLALNRLKGREPKPEELEDIEPAIKEQFNQFLWTLPKQFLADKARQAIPGISDEQVDDFLSYVDKIKKKDPLTLDQTMTGAGGQMIIYRSGANLEMSLFISHITGAFPYTNLKAKWEELLSADESFSEAAKIWSPLTKAFQTLEFKFLNNVDSNFACSLRKDGRLEMFRAFLRRLWNSLSTEYSDRKMEALARDFRDELTGKYNEAKSEWQEIDRLLMKTVGATMTGAIISGKLSFEIPALGFCLASVLTLINARWKRKTFRKKIPMSVFVDLERHKHIIK